MVSRMMAYWKSERCCGGFSDLRGAYRRQHACALSDCSAAPQEGRDEDHSADDDGERRSYAEVGGKNTSAFAVVYFVHDADYYQRQAGQLQGKGNSLHQVTKVRTKFLGATLMSASLSRFWLGVGHVNLVTSKRALIEKICTNVVLIRM